MWLNPFGDLVEVGRMRLNPFHDPYRTHKQGHEKNLAAESDDKQGHEKDLAAESDDKQGHEKNPAVERDECEV